MNCRAQGPVSGDWWLELFFAHQGSEVWAHISVLPLAV